MSIVHPGVPHPRRRLLVRGRATPLVWTLPAGTVLLEALAARLEESQADTAVAILDGLVIASGEYVMPARSPDAEHAAWYSGPQRIGAVQLEHATAMIGRRDGAPFAHTHAVWPGPRMGHLLNETVRIGAATEVRAWAFMGGTLVSRPDAETNFQLFVPEGAGVAGNAALLTLRPHERVPEALAAAGLAGASVFGLGSLIGARFADAPTMADPISEMLVLPGAQVGGALPVAVVDLGGRVHRGTLLEAPICVTGEFLLVGADGVG